MEDNKFVLEVSDLHTTFKTDNGDVSAVNGVSFKLEPGKTLGIVGESGSAANGPRSFPWITAMTNT